VLQVPMRMQGVWTKVTLRFEMECNITTLFQDGVIDVVWR
jgi:hypothetical protein